MGFMSTMPNDQQRIDSMGADDPVLELHADNAFDGSFDALTKGVVGGAAAVGRLAYDGVLSGLNKSTELTYDPSADPHQVLADQSEQSPQINAALKATQDWAKIDPRVDGSGAQILGTLSRGATIAGMGALAGGPAGAATLLAGTEGYNDYREKMAAGVDSTTALESAALTGTLAGASTFLPFKFGSMGVKGMLDSMAGGAVVNTGFGIAQHYLAGEILSANGYKDMAEQYRHVDGQSLAADAILGLAFGGFAHLTHGADIPVSKRPTDDVVEQAIEARRNDAINRAGPGIPVDPQHSTLDGDLQDRALGNMLRGKPADITADESAAMVEHSLADPERVQLTNDYNDANTAVHGELADFSEPARLPEQDFSFPPREAASDLAGADGVAPASPLAHLPTLHQEMLRQMIARDPDMVVPYPDLKFNDGTLATREGPVSGLPDALAADYERQSRFNDLHDVAIACFLRG